MDSLSSKSLRDEEHILALNYENICDADYLNKLFSSTLNSEDDRCNIPEGSKKSTGTHSLLMSPELPEALVLFGKENKLGSTSILMRGVRELIGSMKHFDVYSSITEKQIAVFQYIANYLLSKYSEKPLFVECSSILRADNILSSSTIKKCDGRSEQHLVSDSMLNMLRIFDEKCSRFTSLSEIEPVMTFMSKISYETFSEPKNLLDDRHMTLMCSILSNIVCKAFDQYLSLPLDTRSSSALLKLALKSSYTMLSLGVQSKDFNFLLATIINLMTTNIFIASLSEDGGRIQQHIDDKKETGYAQHLLQSSEKMSVKAKLLMGNGGFDRVDSPNADINWSDLERDAQISTVKSISKSWEKGSVPSRPEAQKDPIKNKKKGSLSNQDTDGSNDPFRGTKKTSEILSLSDRVAMKSASHTLQALNSFDINSSTSIAQKLSTVPKSVIAVVKNSYIKAQMNIDGLFKSFSSGRTEKRKTQVKLYYIYK